MWSRRARAGEEAGDWTVTGIWSHFACSDEPDHPANDAQEKVFLDALDVAEQAGLRPEVRHLANSAAAILRPSSRFDLVRCGIASYGLDPAPGRDARHRPGPGHDRPRRAVAGQADPVRRRRLLRPHLDRRPRHHGRPGAGRVRRRRTPPRRATSPRSGSPAGAARSAAGSAWTSSWSTSTTSCPTPGAGIVLFGTGSGGEPTATDWAEACGTINYEIVTRIGGRMVRRYVDEGVTRVSVRRRIAGVAAGAVGVAVAGTAVEVARRRRVIARRGAGDRDAVRLAAVDAGHRGRRRRRPPARRGRRVRPHPQRGRRRSAPPRSRR